MTRISVAHRPDISTGTDRILWVGKPGSSEHGVWLSPADRRPDAVGELDGV